MVKLEKWFFPLNYWKYRPSGLHFLWLMKICILQYAIVRPLCTLVAVGLQYYGLYCLESWEPYFGHIYISLAISISVSIAMYCVIQFYLPIQEELKPYSPVLKFLAVKSVVFLTFWQDSFLSVLVYFGAIKPSEYMSAADIQVGINALLETFEMVIFGFLHIKAFTYLIYRPPDRKRVTRRGKALLDVLDFRDWYYQMSQSSRYVVAKSRGRDFTIVEDIRRDKYTHLERALGRDRWTHLDAERRRGKQQMPSYWAAGCEPKDGDDEDFELSDTGDVEKRLLTSEEDKNLNTKQKDSAPRRLAAMHPDYDPEADDEGALDAQQKEDSHRRQEETTQMLPTLPTIDIDDLEDPNDANQESHLGSYDAADETPGRVIIGLDADPPSKGGRARKEASLGLGAWWRAFRERVSSHAGGEALDGDNFAEDTKLEGDLKIDQGSLLDSFVTQRQVSGDSDAPNSAICSRTSPLTAFIVEHGRKEDEASRPTLAPRIATSTKARAVAIVDRSRMEDPWNAAGERPSQALALENQTPGPTKKGQPSLSTVVPPHMHDDRKGAAQKSIEATAVQMSSMHSSRVMPQLSQNTLALPEMRNIEPSISAWTPPTPSLASASRRDDPPSLPPVSTAAQQKQKKQNRSPAAVMTAVGPKGRAISVILPQPLSSDRSWVSRDAQPNTPELPVSSTGSLSSKPRQLVHAPSQRDHGSVAPTKEKPYVDPSKTPKRSYRDDPEMEKPSLEGWVVAGPVSLTQSRAREMHEKAHSPRQEQIAPTEQREHTVRHHSDKGAKSNWDRDKARRVSAHNSAQQASHSARSQTARESHNSGLLGEGIPAPSQLLDSHDLTPFDAAKVAIGGPVDVLERQRNRPTSHEVAQYDPKGRPLSSSRQASFQVGSVVSRRDVALATAPPPPPPLHYQGGLNSRLISLPRHSMPDQGDVRYSTQPHNPQRISLHSPSSLSRPPSHQGPSPSSHHAQQSHYVHLPYQRPPPLPVPQDQWPAQSSRTESYHRYTGEPLWRAQDASARSSRANPRPAYRQAQVGRQPPQSETREGFHFDYID